MAEALLAALGRKKVSYRAAALACLQSALVAFHQDIYVQVAPPLLVACTQCAPPAPPPFRSSPYQFLQC